jgi:hypothetical protein
MSDEAEDKAGAARDREPQPAPPREERMTRAERVFVRINVVQTVLAVAGVFTGAVALYAALNESAAVRRQSEAAVWPHIRVTDLNYGVPGEERFDIIVGNRGIGPARIKQVKLTVDGQEYLSWYDVVSLVDQDGEFGISNNVLSDAVLSANEDIIAVSLDARFASKETTLAFRDLARSGRANLEICYCSVFESCWRLNAQDRSTAQVDRCQPSNPESEL